MPKLLIVTTIPRTLAAFLLPYSDYFRKKGWQVDALTGEGQVEDLLCHFDKIWEVHWTRNPLDLRNILGTPKKIREIVEREGYDIVHVHTPIAAFVTRFALRRLRKKGTMRVIYTAHGFHFYKGNSFIKNSIFLSLEKIATRWTDHIIVINEEDYESALNFGLRPVETISLHPGIGLDLSAFSPERVSAEEVSMFRNSLGLRRADPLFVMIAEFNPGKRHVDCLEAFLRLEQENAHLAFVGTGPLESQMRKRVEHLGLSDKVHFLGYREDIPIILKSATGSILPSQREGMPRVIMESMSMGTPVIASKIRGNIDLLKNGSGFLFPVGDSQALADMIKIVLSNGRRTKEAIAIGKNTINRFSSQALIDRHESLYFKLITIESNKS